MMRGSMRLLSMMSGSMRLLSMMRNDEREHRLLSMMSLIFRCRHYDENRHHDESEHNDGRVSPLVNKGEPHFANNLPLGELCTSN
jgi:hypothetical protein